MKYGPEFEIIAELLLYVYLLWAAFQDIREKQVVRYTHMCGLAAVCLQTFTEAMIIRSAAVGDPCVTSVFSGNNLVGFIRSEWLICLCLHWGLQYISQLLRLYGLADAIILFVCGMYWGIHHGIYDSFLGIMLLQAVAGIALFFVQILKKNLKGTGFKSPVPYIPYIFIAFFLTNGVLWG